MSKLIFSLLRRLPRDPRELLRTTFTLCVLVAALTSQVEIFYVDNLPNAALFTATAYGATMLFAHTYAIYANKVEGNLSSDSLNGRKVATGRQCFHLLGILSGLQLLGWAVHFAAFSSFNPLAMGVSVLGIFLTVLLLGIANRLFVSCVSYNADVGIKRF